MDGLAEAPGFRAFRDGCGGPKLIHPRQHQLHQLPLVESRFEAIGGQPNVPSRNETYGLSGGRALEALFLWR